MTKPEPLCLTLARDAKLDNETAFTICRMIEYVGSSIRDDWDWDWLRKKRKNYRKLIDLELLKDAWDELFQKDWFSLQTTNDVDKRISTIVPLEGLTNLRSLVLQNNLITDLRTLSGMTQLRYLSIYSNRISDLTPLRNLHALEGLSLGGNPVESLRVLEELPNLRELALTPDQLSKFEECEKLPRLAALDIYGDQKIPHFKNWPDMPGLKLLKAYATQNLEGLERFTTLETLRLSCGTYSDLTPLRDLKGLTHLELITSQPLAMASLAKLHALRSLVIHCPKIDNLDAIANLPVLAKLDVGKSECDRQQLEAIQNDLGSWDKEFKTEKKKAEPSLHLEVVDQETFDYYDSKAAYGIQPGQIDDGMLESERDWLIDEIREAISLDFSEDTDFVLPHTTGTQRTERLILYSLETYESFRDIALAVQRILCHARNDWIIWCQSLLWESPEDQDIPEGVEDFIVWIYPNKITVAEQNAETVRKLVAWDP
jgi:Leucine-rich repeat (LRR) protein